MAISSEKNNMTGNGEGAQCFSFSLTFNESMPLMGMPDKEMLLERLRDKLTIAEPLGRPSEIIRRNRLRLCDFIRSVESQVFQATGVERHQIRLLLGWDDDTFENFIESPLLTHSSPHASMNAFPPMLIYPWVQASLQRLSGNGGSKKPVHLRTMVTHNNLGDLRWRPYAWWHRGRDGKARKVGLFPRNHNTRHKTLLSQPIPAIDLSNCNDLDREAIQLANRSTCYAYFCIIYRAMLERRAGLHEPNGTIEAPLNIINALTFERERLDEWLDFAQSIPSIKIKTLDRDGELAEISQSECAAYAANLSDLRGFPILCSNYANFAQVYQFGITTMIGAEKMAHYVKGMNEIICHLYTRCGWHYPYPLFIPVTRVNMETIKPADEPSRRFLEGYKISATLPISVADYDVSMRERLDRLLDLDYGDFFPVEPANSVCVQD